MKTYPLKQNQQIIEKTKQTNKKRKLKDRKEINDKKQRNSKCLLKMNEFPMFYLLICSIKSCQSFFLVLGRQ